MEMAGANERSSRRLSLSSTIISGRRWGWAAVTSPLSSLKCWRPHAGRRRVVRRASFPPPKLWSLESLRFPVVGFGSRATTVRREAREEGNVVEVARLCAGANPPEDRLAGDREGRRCAAPSSEMVGGFHGRGAAEAPEYGRARDATRGVCCAPPCDVGGRALCGGSAPPGDAST